MTQTFNNQVMFGHREWSILAENNTPLPVGPDNQPLVDKPLIREQAKREPSKVEENVEEDSGIVGYMGDDEDIEQAKYNVMSLISDKIGGLDTRLERINQELSVLINSNERDITELRSEFESDECTPFLISKCDDEQTYEGCTACANYWRDNNQLPENCNQTTIHNHCSYNNTYITQSSPGAIPVIGEPESERESIKVGTTPSPGYECDKLGHFDCNQIITENVSKYQQDMDTICMWDLEGPLTNGFNVKPGYRGEASPSKCRRRCVNYVTEDDCNYNTCIWSSPSNMCVENICENRLGPGECKAIENTDRPDTICGYEKLLIGETEGDRSSPSLFNEWSEWFGLKYNRLMSEFDSNNPLEIICMKNDGSGPKQGQGHLPGSMEYNRDYCEGNVEYDNSGTLLGESDQKRGTVVDFYNDNTDTNNPIFYRSSPIGVGANNVTWKNTNGIWTPQYRTETGSVGRTYDILPTCRDKNNINRDVVEQDGHGNTPRAGFYCDLYSYSILLSSPDNPCSSSPGRGDIRVDINASPGDDNSGNTVAEFEPEAQNLGCQAKDKGMVKQLIIQGDMVGAQGLCENKSPSSDSSGIDNPNNCYIGVPTNQSVGSPVQTTLSFGDNYFDLKSSPNLEQSNYNSDSLKSTDPITHQYLDTLNTCNSGQGPKPDCRLLSGESSLCNGSSPNHCQNDSTGKYEKGRCGPKSCSTLKQELGCHLGIINSADNDIKQKASESIDAESNNWVNEVISKRTDWEKGGIIKPGYNDTRDAVQNIETYITTIGRNDGTYCQPSSSPLRCETNSEITTVIDDLSKLRYNSLQGELDNLWIWYLVLAVISLLLVGFSAYLIFHGDLVLGGNIPDTLFFICLVFVPIFYFGLLINLSFISEITDNKDIYGSNKDNNCVRSPEDDPIPPPSLISEITEQLNECLEPLDKLESAVGGIWWGIPTIIYITAILIYLFTDSGGGGAAVLGRGAGAAVVPAVGGAGGLASGLTGYVADKFGVGGGAVPPTQQIWERIIITIGVFFVICLIIRFIIYLFRDKITSIDTKTLDFSSSAEMFPSPPEDQSGLFGVGGAQDIPGASPGQIDITKIYPCRTYRATFDPKFMQEQLEDYQVGSDKQEEMDNLFKAKYDELKNKQLNTGDRWGYDPGKSPWYSYDTDYRLIFDDNWSIGYSTLWILVWLIISIIVILLGLIPIYVGNPAVAGQTWLPGTRRATDNPVIIIGVILFYAYSFLWVLPNLFSWLMFLDTKDGNFIQANGYYNNFYTIDKPISFGTSDTPAKGPCLAEKAFCDTRTFNEGPGQDNFRQYQEDEAKNNNICLSDPTAWDQFIDNNINAPEYSFWDIFWAGMPSRSQWAASNVQYKTALKNQIKFNSYIKYLEDTNRSLEDTRRDTLAKEFYKEDISPDGRAVGGWLPLLFGTFAALVCFPRLATRRDANGDLDLDPANEKGKRNIVILVFSGFCFVILSSFTIPFVDNAFQNKEKAWYRIATRGYNLWKGKDYQYYLNNCGSDDSHKCIVKSAGENNINEANSIFEIKLPNGQTREADIYECDKFNGCLLSDFKFKPGEDHLTKLNEKCPQSGFTEGDIDQVQNLTGNPGPTGECSNEDNMAIVDLFRYYHGLPGTVNYRKGGDKVFQGIDELDTSIGKEGRPSSFFNAKTGWGGFGLIFVSLIVLSIPYIYETYKANGNSFRIQAGAAAQAAVAQYVGTNPETIFHCAAIALVTLFIIPAFVILIANGNKEEINNYIQKLNNKYITPDPDITENISAIGTRRSSPQSHRPPNTIQTLDGFTIGELEEYGWYNWTIFVILGILVLVLLMVSLIQ
jgi:hypothetical protein